MDLSGAAGPPLLLPQYPLAAQESRTLKSSRITSHRRRKAPEVSPAAPRCPVCLRTPNSDSPSTGPAVVLRQHANTKPSQTFLSGQQCHPPHPRIPHPSRFHSVVRPCATISGRGVCGCICLWRRRRERLGTVGIAARVHKASGGTVEQDSLEIRSGQV